jgi:hypothetical protein
MMPSAITTLTAAYAKAGPHAGDTAVLTWPSVPVEIVRAAGLSPFVIRSAIAGTPSADLHLEPGIFPGRLRWLMDAALTGDLSAAACIVVPRTSDPDYKCFLYLREFIRQGLAPGCPPVLLFDLLQSDGPEVRAYNAARVRALLHELAAISGRTPLLADLGREIIVSNAARAAASRLTALRRGTPRVSGAEVIPLLGAFWIMAPEKYVALAGAAADDITRRSAMSGLRVLVAGAPVDGPGLHAAIEAHGGIVVAEVGPWGSALAGEDVDSTGDPLAAIADHYRMHAFGPRTPARVLRAEIEQTLRDIDAAVIYLPPDDAVFGWDYPALRDRLQANRIPHIRLRGDPSGLLTAEENARVIALLGSAVRKELSVG